MPLSLRARETLALVTVVLLVVAVATVAHVASVAQITTEDAAAEGKLLARQLFHQSARAALAGASPSPAALRGDTSLRALLEGMIGYSRVVVYAAIVDPAGRAVVHSDSSLEGTTLRSRPSLDDVLAWGSVRMALALLGEPQIYEAQLPLRLAERPFATIRVGISTSLIRQAIRDALVRSVALGAGALVAAVAVGLGAGRVFFESLRRIARRVERLARGDEGPAVELARGDTLGELAERVDRLGAQIQADPTLQDLEPEPAHAVESLVTYSQKLAALGRLTSGVAHEVKNPLNAMRIHLELLKTRLTTERPEVTENLEVIAQEIQRLDRVVQGFLRFMRPQDLRLGPVDLNAVLADVARLQGPEATRGGVEIVLDAAPDVAPVTGDAELLQQAFTNLVTNAIQAMSKGGKLTLATRALSQAVEVQVADRGVGIPREDLDKIFRLYYTTKENGSGIGLSIVWRIIQMHDGRIDVESAVGEGTTMIVTLPLVRVPPAA